jgi:hypothetical protein
MNSKCIELLKSLLNEFARDQAKAPNYTNTYTRRFLIADFVPAVTEAVLYKFCIEINADKHVIDDDYRVWMRKQQDGDQDELNEREREAWWENAIMDKRAEQEAEYRDSLDKDT